MTQFRSRGKGRNRRSYPLSQSMKRKPKQVLSNIRYMQGSMNDIIKDIHSSYEEYDYVSLIEGPDGRLHTFGTEEGEDPADYIDNRERVLLTMDTGHAYAMSDSDLRAYLRNKLPKVRWSE